MCGRYAASSNTNELLEAFHVDLDRTDQRSRSVMVRDQNPPAGSPDFNMAPTKQAPVIMTRTPRDEPDADPVRQLRLLTWGLLPSWAKDPKIGMKMINARAETVLDKSAYAKAARTRRCLVPARAWYEWQKSPTELDAKGKPRKQPFAIARENGADLAFAGLYEFWKHPDAQPPEADDAWVVSFTIITTAAEPGLDRIHDRQPVVLEPHQWNDWLDPQLTAPDDVRALLEGDQKPGRFIAWPVSTAVNGPGGNGPHLLDPVPASSLAGVLDPTTGEILGNS